jgi:hypothetical protein
VPPFVGVAVKVTLVPAHIAPEGDAVMLTEGVTEAATLTVVPAEVAVVGDTQVALEVKTTVTTSPLFKVELVKVEAVAPATFTPLTCH